MVQVNLKLKLCKKIFGIKVSYNTFEKATYDQYLISSLALRSKDEEEALNYIDDITGAGSLNAHFKHLYDEIKKLTDDQLKDIMNNSMFPMLRIDKSNSYVYYPELDVSVFNNTIYEGDFGKLDNLIEKLYIQEKVIDQEIFEKSTKDNPEPYEVIFNNNEIKIKIANQLVNVSEEIFQNIYVNELDQIKKFGGVIHEGADGSGWYTLTNSVINNLYSSKNYFYDEEGNHCLIRNDNIRKTYVSKIAGLYIYREEIVHYEGNNSICEKVIEILKNNKSINEFKTKSLILILSYVDDLIAQDVINYVLSRKESKELALLGISLLNRGVEKNWENEALKSFMQFADSSQYGLIYKSNPRLVSDMDILININPDYLTPTHKKKVEEYKNDFEERVKTLNLLVGEISNSSTRENVKKLTSDDVTKRFTKLANTYIGHNKNDFTKATLKELDKYLKDITELHDLMKIVQQRLDEQGDK